MPGLSPDPAKASRQLEGLATSNSRLSPVRIAEIVATPAPEPAPEPAPVPVPPAPAASTPPALGEGPPATVAGLPVRPASHHEEPVHAAPEPAPEPEPEPAPEPGPEPEPGPDDELEPEPAGWRGFLEGLAFG